MNYEKNDNNIFFTPFQKFWLKGKLVDEQVDEIIKSIEDQEHYFEENNKDRLPINFDASFKFDSFLKEGKLNMVDLLMQRAFHDNKMVEIF